MKTVGNVILLITFIVVLLIAISVAVNVSTSTYHSQERIALSDFVLSWIIRVAGAFIAGLAALLMLGRAINDTSLTRLFVFIPPFLARLLLIQVHWSVALSLGAVGLALAAPTVIQAFHGRGETDTE